MIISIQFLRFIAAFLVFIHHIYVIQGVETSLGYRGVDLFFVVSGFVIYIVTEKENKDFFLNRLIRIVPMYWSFTILLIFLFYFFGAYINSEKLNTSMIIQSLLFIPFYNENFGSFSPILNIGWTLNYEMFFYLVFYISMLISLKYRALICSMTIVLFFLIGYIFQDSKIYFYSDSIVFEFILGMIVGNIYLNKKYHGNNAYLHILFGSLLFIPLLSIYLTNLPRVVVPGLISTFIVFMYIFSEPLFRGKKTYEKIIESLGDISYAMYLCHYFVIVFFIRILEINLLISAIFYIPIILIVTLMISYVVTYYYDYPIRRYLRKLKA